MIPSVINTVLLAKKTSTVPGAINFVQVLQLPPRRAKIDRSGSAALIESISNGVVLNPFPTTWNPNDKTANMLLSNGNLTVTDSGIGDNGVRATNSYNTGKHYFEITIGSSYAGADATFGIITATGNTTTFAHNCTAGAGVILSGDVFINGVDQSVALGAPTTGNVMGCAIDLVNMRAWFRNGVGNWNGNGSANPATNTLGFDISGVFSTAVPAFPVQSLNSAGDNQTTNFGASAFVNGPPSGFTKW